ncbi:pyridoxal phosphate-dependent aminotransferase [Corallococcus sicarius]|uniref:pyridoxal phosphate-dependent aminotransferase n=1 Tax=Corallococcus sicarius TaxID=2316726 RepID=UPI0013158C3B|nr:histidinol-phosphate transaminase [Corallococcus sicarius]
MSESTPSRRALLSGATATAAALALRPSFVLAAGARARGAPAGAPVRLFANENNAGPCAGALRAIRDTAPHLGHRYAGRASADAFARRIGTLHGVDASQVVLTAGSTEVLTTAAVAFGLNGGEVVCADNTFPVLPLYAERVGGKVVRVPLDARHAHDLAAMEARVGSGTRLVYVVNPNSPTGTVLDPVRLRAFCEAVSPRATVLVDEAYVEYLDPATTPSMVDLVRAGRNVIVLRTFSKAYALAGLRVGYALAPPAIAERLRGLRMSLPNPVALAAAGASLDDPDFVALTRKRIAEARAITVRALDAAGLAHVGDGGNFLWVQAGPSRRDLPPRLAAHGLHITWTPDQPLTEDWFRLTLGTVEDMRRFGSALHAVTRT